MPNKPLFYIAVHLCYIEV